MVEEWPDPGRAAAGESQAEDMLLGLYEGTPYPARGTDYHLATPARSTLSRGPILDL